MHLTTLILNLENPAVLFILAVAFLIYTLIVFGAATDNGFCEFLVGIYCVVAICTILVSLTLMLERFLT